MDRYHLEKTIDKLLDEPLLWTFASCTANCQSFSLWIGNGFLFFGLYRPTERRFSIFWKWHLWRKVKHCIAQQIATQITESPRPSVQPGQWLN